MNRQAHAAEQLSALTHHEIQVLRLGRDGNSSRQIADLLALSLPAVLRYQSSIYDKLGIATLPQAARLERLSEFQEADRIRPTTIAVPQEPEPEPGQPSPIAEAAVEADDRLLAGRTAAPELSERETVRMVPPLRPTTVVEQYADPAPVLREPGPPPMWGGGFGPVLLIALVVAALVVAAIVIFAFARPSQQPTPPPQAVVPVATVPAASAPVAPAQPTPAVPTPATPTPVAPAAVAPTPLLPAPAPVASAPQVPAVPVVPAIPPPSGLVTPVTPVTPAANATVVANTSPGTVLTVGQTWQQDGLELQLTSIQASTNGLTADFHLTNRRSNQVTFRFTRGSVFTATDNRNDRLAATDPNHVYSFALAPNAMAILDSAHPDGPISFTGAIANPAVNSITISVNGLDSISDAQWRAGIQH